MQLRIFYESVTPFHWPCLCWIKYMTNLPEAASLVVVVKGSPLNHSTDPLRKETCWCNEGFGSIQFPVMVTVFSPLQNLTFEDIHAVRTYEKAWVLRLRASQNQPRSVEFIIIIDWLYASLCTSSSSTCSWPAGCTFCKNFFFIYEYISVVMDGSSLQPCVKHEIKNTESKCLSLLWCTESYVI